MVRTYSIGFLVLAFLAPKYLCFGAGDPNVIVIVSDDAGWADFGFMDSITGENTEIHTPNLDALAARGVKFSNAYTAAVCAPSRAMMVTGQYSGRLGFYNIPTSASTSPISETKPQGLMPQVTTIWERMRAEGYSTGAVGKWHLGLHNDEVLGDSLIAPGNQPPQQGVDEFFGFLWGSRQTYYVGSEVGVKALRTAILDENGMVDSTIVESDFSGQHLTELIGQQSANFIQSHHQDADPFFLYTAFYAPHNPISLGTLVMSDYNDPRIAGIADDNRRRLATNMLTMDRAVGEILGRLDDPNGDGNTNDSIRDDTLIVFMNDNGGDCCLNNGTNYANNGVLQQGKGWQYEGGIRVPMIIAGAGIDPAVYGNTYDSPVHAIDIVPTVIGAAGGAFDASDVIDGVDLIPYVNGQHTSEPHESLFTTVYTNQISAVRKGNYKFMSWRGTPRLYDLSTDPGETTNLAWSLPEVRNEMERELVSYHVQTDKPRVDSNSTDDFDHYRLRDDSPSATSWTDTGIWANGEAQSGNFTLSWTESYANLEVTFPTKQGEDYHSTNDLTSMGRLPALVNRINFVHETLNAATANTATITGWPIMMTRSLSGVVPELNFAATDSIGADQFTFNLGTEVRLYDDLTISGEGNQNFIVSGRITEYMPGRNITKAGANRVTLSGGISIAGEFHVESGTIDLASAEMTGSLKVANDATLVVGGDGVAATPLTLELAGSYTHQQDANLAIDLFGEIAHDKLQISAEASLAGRLVVASPNDYRPDVGDSFNVILASDIEGTFGSLSAPSLGDGLMWRVEYSNDAVWLRVALAGDYNHDGRVELSDYAVWRDAIGNTGAGLPADGDGSGTVDLEDYSVWRSNFGRSVTDVQSIVSTVPEPSSIYLVALLALVKQPFFRKKFSPSRIGFHGGAHVLPGKWIW